MRNRDFIGNITVPFSLPNSKLCFRFCKVNVDASSVLQFFILNGEVETDWQKDLNSDFIWFNKLFSFNCTFLQITISQPRITLVSYINSGYGRYSLVRFSVLLPKTRRKIIAGAFCFYYAFVVLFSSCYGMVSIRK